MKKSGKEFHAVLSTVAKLRDPQDGCPWDLKQTHESLARYLDEESAEVLEVLDGFDSSDESYIALADELGDVLLQVLLHSQLASENGKFTIYDVLERLNDKLIRRHPHVFGESDASTVEEVEEQWKRIKEEEKKSKES